MIRKTLVVVCLVLMLALSVIAVRSYWVHDVIRYFGPTLNRTDGSGGTTPWGCEWAVSFGSSYGHLALNLARSPGPRNTPTGLVPPGPRYQGTGENYLFTRNRFQYEEYYRPLELKALIDRDGLLVLALPFRGLHFEWRKTTFGSPVRRSWLRVPITFLLVFLGAYPTYVMVRWWRASPERRRRRGLCVECGYNLRGNESGVCPECGTTTPHTSVSAG